MATEAQTEPQDPTEPCPHCATLTAQYYGEVSTGCPYCMGCRLAYAIFYECPRCSHRWVIRFDSGPLNGTQSSG